ncbi:MAG: lycopene cyclase [Polyangiaceae bacterium]|jgi:lycopene cyclase CruA|nr:lycopene cyclase [Polyangiaceae bacterium]
MNDLALAEGTLRECPGGAEALERIEHLERSWGRRLSLAPLRPPGPGPLDADVVFAGGGLWLTLAPYLARKGLKVVVLERHRAGTGHREWNISGPELQALVHGGLFTQQELDALVVARYSHGVCRWHDGGSWPVTGVLDHAVDGEAYLAAIRTRAEQAGVRILDGHSVDGLGAGPHGVLVRARDPRGAPVEVSARVLVDALGSSSPHARVDLGCPTVGGVLDGLEPGSDPDQVDQNVGDILVTTEHREEGRQHIWEGFPANDALTTYLFYYARAEALPARSLLALYGRFFRTLPRYKKGTPRVRRLTYGIIPGWSRLRPAPSAPLARVLLVGDAAARHSPLTFCGFGSMVRSFAAIGDGLLRCLDERRLTPADLDAIQPDLPLLQGVGALALLMAEPRPSLLGRDDPAATNRLLDAAFGSMHRSGNDFYASLLRDEMAPAAFVRFLYGTSLLRKEVYTDVWKFLGPGEVGRWALGIARGVSQGALGRGAEATGSLR